MYKLIFSIKNSISNIHYSQMFYLSFEDLAVLHVVSCSTVSAYIAVAILMGIVRQKDEVN
jgi:hypothetical protein